MKRRNWLELSRKLVDQYDMDFTVLAIQQEIGNYALGWFGEGVLETTAYPDPFPITLSVSAMGGSVGNGMAFNDEGLLCAITPLSTTAPNFTIPTANPSLARWDLLVLRYKETGDTPIPKPSDPITSVNLNLHDDFQLVVRPGTPGASAYPAQQAGDVILAGIQVPAGATFGSQCSLDLSIREKSRANFQVYPVFVQEDLSGGVDGMNATFVMTQKALNPESLLVFVDGIPLKQNEYVYNTLYNVVLNDPPQPGQTVSAYYVAYSDASQNPLSGFQETPLGSIDGVNDTFTLSGDPADQRSTLVFINGLALKANEWTLLQNGGTSKIKIGSASIPVAGQSVYVFYFVNPSTVGSGSGGGGGGGGGGGTHVVFGSIGAPEIITAGVGVGASTDDFQVHFIQAAGPAMTVTADPQIAPGTAVGQEMKLKGTSDTNYVILEDGAGLALNGQWEGRNKSSLTLTWDGEVWSEDGRK